MPYKISKCTPIPFSHSIFYSIGCVLKNQNNQHSFAMRKHTCLTSTYLFCSISEAFSDSLGWHVDRQYLMYLQIFSSKSYIRKNKKENYPTNTEFHALPVKTQTTHPPPPGPTFRGHSGSRTISTQLKIFAT